MKQFLFLAGSLLLAGTTAHAQLGLRLGGNLSNLHVSDGPYVHAHSGTKLGYQVGLTYELPLAAHLSLVPEVQYSDEQATLTQQSYDIIDESFTTDLRQHLRYLSVPVLVRATWGPAYLEAGPQAGLLLSARQTGTLYSFGWGGSQVSAVDQDASYQRFDVGPSVGLGVKLPAGLGVSVRAYRGLVTLNHATSASDGAYRRQSLQASLTYQLTTGHQR